MLISRRRRLNRLKVLRLLDDLERAGESAISLYITPGSPVSEIEQMLDKASGMTGITTDFSRTIARSPTGAAFLWGEHHKYLILPPFPITATRVSSGYSVELLRSLLQQELMIALILVRLGAYAIGVFQNERLISSKVGTGLVHARHKKGGSSQQRFARHREKQMESFFDRVCLRVQEKLGPYIKELDYVIYGGESNTLLSFRKRCQFLKQVDERTLGLRLNIREPRQATLEAAISDAWSSEVIQWDEN